jgi:hypothetical protein
LNILTDKLPTFLQIGDSSCAINADFRNCLKIIMAIEDPSLARVEKNLILYNNLYKDRPTDIQQALEMGIWFLNLGKEMDSDGVRVFSWQKDADLIYSAYQQTHGIDLEAIEFMHWWKFMALFMDLGSDTVFCNLVSLRKRVKTGKASKEERSAARELGDMFLVPEIDDRTVEEIEAEREFLSLVGKKGVKT